MIGCVTLTLYSREVAAAVARLRAAAAHGRVRLHLALPPRRDDPALQRRMRYSDETVGTADVCQQAFRTMCVLRKHVAPGLERARATNQAALLLRVRSGLQRLLPWRRSHSAPRGLGRLRLRQRDRQHVEGVGRLDLVGIDRGRQPVPPLEGAIGPLIAMDLLGLLLRHLLLRALDRQQVGLY